MVKNADWAQKAERITTASSSSSSRNCQDMTDNNTGNTGGNGKHDINKNENVSVTVVIRMAACLMLCGNKDLNIRVIYN